MPFLFGGALNLLGVMHEVEMACTPALVVLAVLAVWRPDVESRSKLFLVTCAVIGVGMIGVKAFHCVLFFTPRTNWKPPYLARQVADQLKSSAVYLCLLMPLCLAKARDVVSWRRRLLIGTGVVALATGSFGFVCRIVGEDFTRAAIGPFLPAGAPVVTTFVLNCISLWHLAGVAAAIALALAAWRSGSHAIVAATALLAFAALGPISVLVRQMSNVGGVPSNLLNWLLVAAMPLQGLAADRGEPDAGGDRDADTRSSRCSRDS